MSEDEEAKLERLRRILDQSKKQFFEFRQAWQQYATQYTALVDSGRRTGVSYLKAFAAQLAVPHQGVKETFDEYSSAVTRYDNEHWEERMVVASKIYERTRKTSEERMPFERQLRDESYSIEAYEEYIDWQIKRMKSKDSLALAETVELIDRAIARDPRSEVFWIVLFDFLSRHETITADLYARMKSATENCPASTALWSCRIRAGCKFTKSRDEVLSDFAASVAHCDFTDPSSRFVDVVAATYASLRCLVAEEQTDAHAPLKFLKDIAGDLTNLADPGFLIGQLLADCQTSLGLIQDARNTWKRLTKTYSSQALFWLQYLQWEIGQQNWSGARSLIKTGCFKTEDAPQVIYDAAMKFEIMHGSLVDFDKTAAVVSRATQSYLELAKQHVSPVQAREEAEGTTSSKRKYAQEENGHTETADAKRLKTLEGSRSRSRETTTVIVRHLDDTVSELTLAERFLDCGRIVNLQFFDEKESNSRVALVEFEKSSHAQAALSRTLLGDNGIELIIESATGTMLFVTNWPASFQAEDIKSLFSQHGHVLDVRLPSLRYDQKRRFAYVQMSTPQGAQAALSLNDHEVEPGMKISVALSDPDLKRERVSAVTESREIFIKRVAWTASREDLTELFAPFGSILSLRLPSKHSTSHHDGVCFIDYESSESATQALSLDGKLLQGMALEVTLAKPRIGGKSDTSRANAKKEKTTAAKVPDAAAIQAKTLGIMNLSDTVNEAQIKAVFEPYGTLRKVELRPDHGGAIIEFLNAVDAGKASLALSGKEIAGQAIVIGKFEELMRQPSSQGEATKSAPTFLAPRKVRRQQLRPRNDSSMKESNNPTDENNTKIVETSQPAEASTSSERNQDYFRNFIN